MVMERNREESVGVAQFKARLSHYLRQVRRGESLTVLDRETPIARVVPPGPEPGAIRVREPAHSLADFQLPDPLPYSTDSLALLLEDRAKR
ncbi:MAG: type II toxin-antitoxin system prevent-host-death family antitoxin [Bdellovibrionota bacterium]